MFRFTYFLLIVISLMGLCNAQTLVELENSRTAYSKKYLDKSTGHVTAHLYQTPIHYLDQNGNFQNIVSNISASTMQDYDYEVTKGPFKAYFKDDILSDKSILVEHRSGYKIAMRFKGAALYDASSNQHRLLGNPSSGQVELNRNQITYKNVYPGMDIRFRYKNNRLKEEIIISDAARNRIPDPSQFGYNSDSTYLAFLIEFQPDSSLKSFVRDSLEVNWQNFKGKQALRFKTIAGKLKFALPLDYAFLENDSLSSGSRIEKLKRRFIRRNGKNFVVSGMPYSWISNLAPGTVVLDPTIVVSEDASHDTWIENTATHGTDHRLIVGTQLGYPKKRTLVKFPVDLIPSNATILDATMKLYYHGIGGSQSNFIDRDIRVHAVFKSWDQATATRDFPWSTSYGSFGELELGADFESAYLDEVEYTTQRPLWKEFDVKSAVERWTSNQLVNNGLVLWATNEATGGTDLRMRSKEYSDSQYHPRLEITYIKPLQSFYYLKDHLGTVRVTVDEAGDMVGYDDYRPFGEQVSDRSGNQGNPDDVNKFTGKELDSELGLYYFGARYYDAEVGRWLGIDPLYNKFPSVSSYTYALNNPFLFFDPNGLFPVTVHTRTFAPYKWFGGLGFKGETQGRFFSASTDENRYKIRSEVDIETDDWSIQRAEAYGSESTGYWGTWDTFSEAEVSTSESANPFTSHTFGNNDALPGSPNIDVMASLNFNLSEDGEENQLLSISGDISGDRFPASESFITDNHGNSVFLGVSQPTGSNMGLGKDLGPVALVGVNNRLMSTVNVNIVVNKDGEFLGVRLNSGKTISIGEWNRSFELQNVTD